MGKLSKLQILLAGHNQMSGVGDHLGNLYHLEELASTVELLILLFHFLTRTLFLFCQNDRGIITMIVEPRPRPLSMGLTIRCDPYLFAPAMATPNGYFMLKSSSPLRL